MAPKRIPCFMILLAMVFSTGISNANYSVVGPKLVRPGNPYLFSVSTYGQKNVEVVLKAGIKGSSGEFLVQKSFTIQSDDTDLLTLEVPNVIPEDTYTFNITAVQGLNFSDSSELVVNRKVHSIFVQTDKVLYKPGQEVLFRVIAITPDLKPYQGKINATIYDTSLNKIKKLVDQQSDNGVITSSLKLSDITPLGQWKIQAETLFASVEKFFQVAEYVLPKFEVQVELPSYFHYNVNNPSLQQDLPISVIAKYTYGQPVKGTASVEVRLNYDTWWANEPQPKITKLVQLADGKGDFSLTVTDLKSLIPASWTWANLAYQSFIVEANVTETVTGVILSGSNTVNCKTERFQLEFLPNTPENYKPGLPYYGYLSLKGNDGNPPLLSDIQNSDGTFKSISIKAYSSYPYVLEADKNVPSNFENIFSVPLAENGYVTFSFPTFLESENINIEASFNDEISNGTITAYKYINKFQTRDKSGIQITLNNTENIIKPSSNMQFLVTTVDEITEFQFQVLAKGLILLSKQVETIVPSKEHSFSLPVPADLAIKLAPEARFVVSYVTPAGELIADSLAITVVDYFANKVSLTFNKNSTEPADDNVYLNIKTKKNSFVGLLAVDQSVLLLSSGNDVTEDMVKNELSTYSEVYYGGGGGGGGPIPLDFVRFKRSIRCCWWPIWLGGSDTSAVIDRAGMFILTDLYVQKTEYSWYWPGSFEVMEMRAQPVMEVMADAADSATASGAPSPSPAVDVRQKFPETWIWSEVVANSSGDYQLKVKVPDTITSWVATGFSVNQDAGLGLSGNPAKITVIKPFFISLNLPYSIIRGEEFALQVTVFNYFGQELKADVKLLASKYFQVIKCETKKKESVDIVKHATVANNDATSVYFWVVATSLGQIPIEVSAQAGLAADAMKATLLIKPEGQTQSYSTSNFIQLTSGKTYDSDFQVTLPPNNILVPGSVVVEITVIGDIIGSAMNNIGDLLQMPYGCGEQNLLNLVPDVYLLKYLTETGQLTAEFDQKAKGFISDGYQRELTYQRNDGSFSAFGNQDQAGSVWLSSFVIKCFHQAKDYIPVEDSKIAQTLDWIIGLQAANGTFSEPPGGRVIHTDMQGGSSSGIAMTAYVLIALLENKSITLSSPATLTESIAKATTFLENNFQSYSSDPYALAIISYAFFKAESSKLDDVLSLLDKLAVNEEGVTYWKKDIVETDSDSFWRGPYSQAKSFNIEIASYVLLVYAQKKDFSKSLPIGKWLIKQRNSFGGFSSTQDTVLALEALASFAPLIIPPSDGAGITISVTGNSDSSAHTFDTITRQNALFLQSAQLSDSTTSVKVHATGEGVALIQLIVKYNVEKENSDQFLTLDLTTKSLENNLNITVSSSWNGTEVTGMVIIEINILTGYILLNDANFIQQIGSTFKRIERSSNKVVIYLDELNEKPLKFDIALQEKLKVANVKPALVKVYRYYQPGSPVTGFYSTTSGQTWEGACPECCR